MIDVPGNAAEHTAALLGSSGCFSMSKIAESGNRLR